MWYVYILKCDDGSYYTGISMDVNVRLQKHNSGKGSRYTRTRRPVALEYVERFESKGMASKREIEIKDFSVENKQRLIKFGNGIKVSLVTKN